MTMKTKRHRNRRGKEKRSVQLISVHPICSLAGLCRYGSKSLRLLATAERHSRQTSTSLSSLNSRILTQNGLALPSPTHLQQTPPIYDCSFLPFLTHLRDSRLMATHARKHDKGENLSFWLIHRIRPSTNMMPTK